MAVEDTCQEYRQPPSGLGNLKIFVVLFMAQADACARKGDLYKDHTGIEIRLNIFTTWDTYLPRGL